MVVLIMQYLAEELRTSHMMAGVDPAADMGEVFRMDAKAEGERVVIEAGKSEGRARPETPSGSR